jgi:hypothetical protein
MSIVGRFSARGVIAVCCAFAAELMAQPQWVDVTGALVNGQATVTYSAIDLGQIGSVFDGNTDTLARTANINPMVIRLSFASPLTLTRSRIYFLGGNSQWRIETADSAADLDSMTGSFRVALDCLDAPHSTWVDRSLTNPYSDFTSVSSEADDWLNYPLLTGSVTSVNANNWGGPDYQRNFLRWWMARFPKVPGRYLDGSNPLNDGKLNNWWGYLVDMNEYAESR